jgi:hypothetical protein
LELGLRVDVPHWVRISIGHLAHIFAERGDVELAAVLLGYVEERYRSNADEPEPTERRGLERIREFAIAALSESEVSACTARGRAMSGLQALAQTTG